MLNYDDLGNVALKNLLSLTLRENGNRGVVQVDIPVCECVLTVWRCVRLPQKLGMESVTIEHSGEKAVLIRGGPGAG